MPWLYPPCTPGGLFLVHTRPAGTSRGPPAASIGEKEEGEEEEKEKESVVSGRLRRLLVLDEV